MPLRLTLRVPGGTGGYSNAREESRSTLPDGTTEIRFAETKPIPTYVAAVAVGPFDVVDAATAGRNRTPLRFIAPRGEASRTQRAAEITKALLPLLEAYTGTPYPYEKLDVLAVPGGHGDEFPGLIRYSALDVLQPKEVGAAWESHFASLCAHELAHMWFGDLVTIQWWNDIWMKEGAASWMADKVVDQWKPEWKVLAQHEHRHHGMQHDSVDAPPLHPSSMDGKGEGRGIDAINYDKGAAVLRMIENWIGDDRMQRTMRTFLTRHSWSAASASDLGAALSEQAGPETGTVLMSFLERSGIPKITAKLECSNTSAAVELSQDSDWKLPVCVAFESGGQRERRCFLLEGKQKRFALNTKSCPSTLIPNENQAGYYVPSYPPEQVPLLLSKSSSLNETEREGVMYDLTTEYRDGRVPFERLLKAARIAAASGDDLALLAAAHAVIPLVQMDIPDELRPGVAHFFDTAFLPRLTGIGWTGGREDTRVATVLRPAIAALVSLSAQSATEARTQVQAVVEGHKPASSIPPGLFQLGARDGEQATLEALTTLLGKAAAPAEQTAIGRAIGSIEAPKLADVILKVTLRPGIPPNGILTILQARPARYQSDMIEFVQQNYDELAKQLGPMQRLMPAVVFRACRAAIADRAESIFRGHIGADKQAAEVLATALKAVRTCASDQDVRAADLRSFLSQM